MNVITYASLIYLNLSMQAKQRTSVENVADVLEAYARAALSAPPATGVPSPEPMAEVISDGVMFLRKQPDGSPWPRGTKLYATPPASEQQQAVVMPEDWTDAQVLDFLSVAMRHVDVQGTLAMQDVRDGFRYVRERTAPTPPQENDR